MKWQTPVLSAILTVALGSVGAQAQRAAAPDGSSAIASGNAPMGDNHVAQWFIRYDTIRRNAQMNPQERQRAIFRLSPGAFL
ncbi:MAG: hypothetical protein HYX67_05390 [Candidatus Melainabacteria bacterium]|nr:hypothetical protein [Candidatus Melainabacteria bacterium]